MGSNRRTSLKEIGNLTASAGAAPSKESRQRTLDNGENLAATKPKPVITGGSQAEGIAKFAHRMAYEDLTPERRERLKVSVLDSLGCAINALGAPPIAACLEQAKQFGGSDARCTLIGGGKANVVYAAQYNTALVR
jgi:MmgE/PrpD N-terminal domain